VKSDGNLVMKYRLIHDDSGDLGFTSLVERVFDPGKFVSWFFLSPSPPSSRPRLYDRDLPFPWTRKISRVFSARTQESEECQALIYTTVREVFAVEPPATLFGAFATSCKTTSVSSCAFLRTLRIFDPRQRHSSRKFSLLYTSFCSSLQISRIICFCSL